MTVWLYRASILVLMVACVGIIYIVSLLVQQDGFVNVDIPFETQDVVKRGEELEYKLHFIKTKEVSTSLKRAIECEDGNLVTLTPRFNSTLPTGDHIVVSSITIPEKTSLSTCILSLTVEYQINPLKSIVKRFVSEPFKVVE